MLKKITLTLSLILLINLQVFSQDEIELVESVPAETLLEQSSLSRTHDVWLKMINEANESIRIETFYFAGKNGEPLDDIMQALKDAAKRGVMIGIIVDSSFYSSNEETTIDELEDIDNISLAKIPMGRIAGGVMHAKFLIVDNENLFIGSQNMDWRAIKHIHEIGVRIKNKELAQSFLDVFNTDLEYCSGVFNKEIYSGYSGSNNHLILNTDNYGKVTVYPAFSPVKLNNQSMDSEETELLKIIENSKDSLLIQIYSYSSKAKNENNYYDKIDNALRSAAAKGVKIKMIIPDWAIKESSVKFIKDLSIVENINLKIITIPQFSEGFILYARVDHSKYFTSDNNISWISTSNWERSYFYNCRNATLIIDNENITSDLSKVFNNIWNGPYAEEIDVNKDYPPAKRN
ncbi:MAG TPA: phospholipase D-like domain-containing protein [Ignavibacteria bacterium]|nr:phospholipase D-like domain-containing protein [Ignavibacteria bacterium]HMR41545.1 phospholipase D-like domain-containing protein [Ignavibacteria bacterium]